MLENLCINHDRSVIKLTHAFRRDLHWFDKFLVRYNGVSMHNHRCIDCQVELDACVDGLGALWKNFVYHISLQRHYLNLSTVEAMKSNHLGENAKVVALHRWLLFAGSVMRAMSQSYVYSVPLCYKPNI